MSPAADPAQEIARLRTELDAVRAAILKTYDAQSYSSPEAGVARERANLATLTAREEALEAKLARLERGGGIGVTYVVPR